MKVYEIGEALWWGIKENHDDSNEREKWLAMKALREREYEIREGESVIGRVLVGGREKSIK